MFSSNVLARLACLLALWLASSAAMAANGACTVGGCIKYYQGSSFSGSTVSSGTLTGVGAGHDLRIFYCGSPNTLVISGVTAQGGTATLASTTNNAGADYCGMAYYPNTTTSTTAVVATFTGTCTNCSIYVEEWAGDATSSVADGQNAAYVALGSGAGQNMPCGNITTATAGDTVEVAVYQVQGVAPTAPSGYLASNAVASWYGFYQTSVAAGTYNPTPTSGASSFNNFILCGGYVVAGGGPSLPAGSLNLMGVGK